MTTLPILLSSCLLMAQPRVTPQSPIFYLSGPEIVKFAGSFGSAAASNETLEQMSRLVLQDTRLQTEQPNRF